jgi:hypothetical protein
MMQFQCPFRKKGKGLFINIRKYWMIIIQIIIRQLNKEFKHCFSPGSTGFKFYFGFAGREYKLCYYEMGYDKYFLVSKFAVKLFQRMPFNNGALGIAVRDSHGGKNGF